MRIIRIILHHLGFVRVNDVVRAALTADRQDERPISVLYWLDLTRRKDHR